MTQDVTGGYVRHRDRMVQQSVFEDLRDTLIAARWLEGTTAQPVRNPEDGTWGLMTTDATQTLPLLETYPVVLIDYFPELEEGGAIAGDTDSNKTALNTLALDNGTRIETVPREVGSNAEISTVRFNMAFYAASDAVAQALLGDLGDRYKGRLIRPEYVELWNYNSDMSAPVVRMAVERFQYTANTDQNVPVSHEVKLYFAELIIEDEIDSA